MRFYNRFILPAVLDHAMHRPVLDEPRRRALAEADGNVLEIGFGSGANLRHYPEEIRSLETIEPDGALVSRAAPRIRAAGRCVAVHRGSAEFMPFADASFDTVVSTFTLCSIADPDQALAEVRRVLRPGGLFLFLEHGLCPDPAVARWQRRLNRLSMCLGGGCRLDRDIRALVSHSGLAIDADAYFLPGTPRLGGYVTQGRARKAP